MRLISWNVNGIRAVMKKDFLQSLETMKPDVLCLQETKAQDDQVIEALAELEGFHIYSNSAVKKGYSGTAILSRTQPLSIKEDMGIEEHDQEGRVLAAEFDEYYLVTVYTPNSGGELKRLGYRQHWDKAFLQYLQQLETHKPVIVCGDFNVAHQPIDLARPKANYNKNAGYMQEEIDGMDQYIASGFLDTFRYKNADQVKYSWWSYRGGARAKNVGWRIDYFLCSEILGTKIKQADILNDIHGSDHCPVLLEL
ncbi:exodeoxyribonuclease III [Gynuella sunshinyii]|uniref:Exonuclease III n=1 Tax=Gynuella sunshinyii YC6258 TaxID=1445510 RepID=A0A0C5VFV6_9GAMM|nr:exodeoxyribonuclease III [Gynuella sunshinyii]AJQ93482.1 exonuclease III [Gynuella sunshinyii YC6258]